jgi:hypothetical protein
MHRTLAMIGLGAVIAFGPVAALAQTDQGASAPSSAATKSTGHKGSHRSYLRHTANSHKERARASAEHIRKMRTGEIPKPQ